MFRGSLVALITPFVNGKLDEQKLKELVRFHIENGTHGLVPCGTTGESATLSTQEHERVVEIVVNEAKKKIPVIAGTGSNSTAEAVELTMHAKKAGADAALLISPYYNKPTQQGLYLHFKKIADEVDIPIILYNIQSRTAVNIEPETIGRLARDCKNIIGVKEASGNLSQMLEIKALCPVEFILISGDDALTLPILSIGGKGVISVVANIVPKDVANLVKEFENGNLAQAQGLQRKLLPLIKAMFIETNPGPVKTAMKIMGRLNGEIRLPLCGMMPENEAKLKKALEAYGLL